MIASEPHPPSREFLETGTTMSAQYTPGQQVELTILRETDLGFVARINDVDEGLLYHSEIFEDIRVGDEIPGYIKKLRDNGGIDLQLYAFGSHSSEAIAEIILKELRKNGGFLAVTDKTPAEKIYELFGVSKKKYKMALGGLYKKRIIRVTDAGIELNTEK